MPVNENAQAIMLLTISFGKADQPDVKPLSPAEWHGLALWLRDRGLSPADLLRRDFEKSLSGWADQTVTMTRLDSLLGRGMALALSLEKWERVGLWVVARSDQGYPERLRTHLKDRRPPVLFGCGNKRLLEKGGIAVVGSRHASQIDLAFAEGLGKKAAGEWRNIVSGGARGVDQAAMFGALQAGGNAIGVPADSLFRAASSSKYRDYLLSESLVLVTPYNPESGFDVGKAMSRNKYIYCLSDAAVVVRSDAGKGGTWQGATECLKAGWVPVWVKKNADAESGNAELEQLGGVWLPDGLDRVSSLLSDSSSGLAEQREPVASSSAVEDTMPAELALDGPAAHRERELSIGSLGLVSGEEEPASEVGAIADAALDQTDFGEIVVGPVTGENAESDPEFDAEPESRMYNLFLELFEELTWANPLSEIEIARGLAIEKSQARAWLKRGFDEHQIDRLGKPVRYRRKIQGFL